MSRFGDGGGGPELTPNESRSRVSNRKDSGKLTSSAFRSLLRLCCAPPELWQAAKRTSSSSATAFTPTSRPSLCRFSRSLRLRLSLLRARRRRALAGPTSPRRTASTALTIRARSSAIAVTRWISPRIRRAGSYRSEPTRVRWKSLDRCVRAIKTSKFVLGRTWR